MYNHRGLRLYLWRISYGRFRESISSKTWETGWVKITVTQIMFRVGRTVIWLHFIDGCFHATPLTRPSADQRPSNMDRKLLHPAQANLGYFLAWFQSLQLPSTQSESPLALIPLAPNAMCLLKYVVIFLSGLERVCCAIRLGNGAKPTKYKL
jgi:hypothetical protein